MRKITPIILLPLLIAACATMSSTSSSDADSAIRALEPRFIAAFNAGDADTVASFYTDDAVYLVAGAPIDIGRTVIRDSMRRFLSASHPNLSFAPDRIAQSCDMAYEYGHYTMQMGSMTDRGNYLTVWRRMPNGDWKIAAVSVATSMPSPAMH